MPVGLIGPREATAQQLDVARILGYALARSGMPLLSGGKGGVMEAAARGCQQAGGIVIGLLPEDDATAANGFLTVALPTGLGITRNALIARASLCLIAVGGGLGTLSEIALGLQWGKRVFTMLDAPVVAGAERFDDIDALVTSVAEWLASEARVLAPRKDISAL
ncbi:TIGR00725 family protein [Cupriavidus sp. TMH.W2]|uniref:TIGR00725 family protein n=1 Tax=Cupriavidus sp. TMH.W2 TaxID=3434465 RepID=UPI003D76A988